MQYIYRLFFISLVLIGIGLAGTTGKISGFVVDKETGEPIPGVNILVKDTFIGGATDVDGFYYILNVPAGTYSLKTNFIGFKTEIRKNVTVSSDFTTKADFYLIQESLELEEAIVVEAETPAVQKDLTSTKATINVGDLRALPVTDLGDAILLKNGVTAVRPIASAASLPVFGQFNTVPGDGLHFRGGRENETTYNIDGMTVDDPIWGGFQIDNIAENGLAEATIFSGTFNAEYGEAMSAVVNMVSQEPGRKTQFSYSGYTGLDDVEKNTYNSQISISGPVPLSSNKLTYIAFGKYYSSDGYLYGKILPNWVDSRGIDKSGPVVKEVPMNYKDNYNGMFSLKWNITNNLFVKAGIYAGKDDSQVYNHYFKYNPYGAPHVHANEQLIYGKVTHTINPSTFYTLGFGRFTKNFKSHVYDTAEDYFTIGDESGSAFSIAGEDFVLFNTGSQTNQIKWELISQLSSIHQLKVGIDQRFYKIVYERRNPGQASPLDTLQFFPLEVYHRTPQKFSAFIQDKMEFDKIGMILNAGLRYDRVDPNGKVPVDLAKPTSSGEKEATIKEYFSPRLGVSYPITESTAFHFSYGHFFQYPKFFQLYQKQNDEFGSTSSQNLSDVQTAFGNANMKPEHTVSYESGVNMSVSDKVTLGITGFYREVTDLIGAVKIGNGLVFENKDFADIKGIELTLNKRYSNYLSGSINYTFTKTKVSSQNIFDFSDNPLYRTIIADWDQPHVFSFDVNIHEPENWGVSIVGSFGSGFPYTLSAFSPNSERAPSIQTIDLQAVKYFNYFGLKQSVFIQVLNLFDRENSYWVHADTGSAKKDNDPSTTDDQAFDPSALGPGRRVRVGMSVGL